MIQFHDLLLLSVSQSGSWRYTISASTGSGLVLAAVVAVLVAVLVAGGWMLVSVGVRIGRSMERHAALALILNPATPAPMVSASVVTPALPAVPVDNGMPIQTPDLHKEMVRDTLTGLWTREAILDQLRREMSRATRQGVALGLVMVKLDHFDQITKDCESSVKETLLQRAASHFVEGLREYDAAGRSGAEFLLVLPGWDPDSNPQRVESMLTPIQMKPGIAGQESLQLTASIGVASFNPSADSPYAEDLLQRADMAVHAAQAAGRNRAEFAPRTVS